MTRLRNGRAAFAASVILMAFCSAAAAQDANAVYTKEQAARGQAQFTANCSECHGRGAIGGEAPALTGEDVMGNFHTAQGMYDYFSVAMPPNNAGQLGEPVYIDILAYLLSVSGAPAGTKPLVKADLESIDLMKVTSGGRGAAAGPAKAADAPAAPRLPQAFTAGKQLPTVAPSNPGGNSAPP